jgi:hypothetical protein
MSKADLQKVTMNLFSGDYAKLQDLYPDIGAATIIRRIVRRFLDQIEESGEVKAEIDVKL